MDDDKVVFGKLDKPGRWAGWLYATDADSGKVAWKVPTPYSILAGVTATAGGLAFTADIGGTVYVIDGGSGKKL